MQRLAIIALVLLICSEIDAAVIPRFDTNCTRCKADVVIILDESSAITPTDFETYIKPFLINLVDGLGVSADGTHVSMVHFSDADNTGVDFYLQDSYNATSLAQKIGTMEFLGGNANLFTALDLTYNQVLSKQTGARWNDLQASYVFIITTGQTTDKYRGEPADITFNMLNDGIAVFAIGVGPLVTKDYLYSLTYDSGKIYMADDISTLQRQDLLDEILEDSCCPIVPKPPQRPGPVYCDVMDLVFLIDESVALLQDPQNIVHLQSFMANLTDMLTISYTKTRVAAIGYGREAKVHFTFNDAGSSLEVKNRIREINFLGGARNTAVGYERAYQEILLLSRVEYGIPVYLVHVAQYAHDVGADPSNVAKLLGNLGVTIYATNVQTIKNDTVFQSESIRIICSGGPGSTMFTASTYSGLVNSGIREQFQEILNKDFLCKNKEIV